MLKGVKNLARSCLLILTTFRPRQWPKNLLIFLPFLFALNVGGISSETLVILKQLIDLSVVSLGFCSLSSAVYITNDLMDLENDRKHPTKRYRPIPAGLVTIKSLILLAVILTIVGFGLIWITKPALIWFPAIYLIVNITYSLGGKLIPFLDAMLVSSGYVLRAVIGALTINVAPSPWLYVVTASGALFIVFSRRYAEIRLAGNEIKKQRAVLGTYRGDLIGQLLTISATATIVSYTLYAIEAPSLPTNKTMLLTVPIVLFGIFRYLHLLNARSDAEYPEHLIFKDLQLLSTIAFWLVTAGLILFLNR